MTFLVIALIALSVTLLTVGVVNAVTGGQARVVRQRLVGLRSSGGVALDLDARRRRTRRRERLVTLLDVLGRRVSRSEAKESYLRQQLRRAGHRHPKAPVLFMGMRLLLAGGLLSIAGYVVFFAGVEPPLRYMLFAIGGLLGWMAPFMILKRRVRARTLSIQRGLADAVDLLVVCVEAGLGLNQALIRVSKEMARVCPEVHEELELATLEMRAGTPRDEALKNMAERTALEDVRSLVRMMVQTDRFGTSIADALRVHSDTMRVKRKQRAEEAAAKLTVKMLIPLVVFVFPALFVVILGPGVLIFTEFMAGK